jgi:hypothetical protein
MLSLLGMIPTILGAIPGVGSIVTNVVGKLYDSKVAITTARIGGDSQVATQIVQAEAKVRGSFYDAMSHSYVLMFLIAGFALPYVVWEWKVIVWDTVLGWGSTEPLRGQVADWATIVIPSLFGSGTIAAAASMYFSARRKD